MSASPVILWFRQDLRLRDNAALHAALARGGPVIPVFNVDPDGEGRWAPGQSTKNWLHHSLAALDASLHARGSRLILFRGESGDVLHRLIAHTGADAVYWNRRYEPAVIARDQTITADLVAAGLDVRSFNSTLLFEPSTVANKQGKPFQVFTAYWRHCLGREAPRPVAIRSGDLPAPAIWPESLRLDELALRSASNHAAEWREGWTPGEAGAQTRLKAFVAQSLEAYADGRDFPGRALTSRLSPHLHFGELGPRQVWAAIEALSKDSGVFPPGRGAQVFLNEVGWREFAYHLLYHYPDTPEQPLREKFNAFRWAEDPGGATLQAWREGRTGYPIVDAGMRELARTGWMHNRVRMITASFLVKHLRLPWQHGAAWFWDHLVDADLAVNTFNWQWSAGCGADASPYFRVFAPVTQGVKFDRDGAYVRRWVPELAGLPNTFLHAPWTAPDDVLVGAGVTLGGNYPRPIVDHAIARAEALAAFKKLHGGMRP